MNEESNSHVRNFKHRKYIYEAEPRQNRGVTSFKFNQMSIWLLK